MNLLMYGGGGFLRLNLMCGRLARSLDRYLADDRLVLLVIPIDVEAAW